MIWATRGAIVVGLCILARQIILNWKHAGGRKGITTDPIRAASHVLPFLAAWCYGALGVLAVGGLIGWAFDAALWITNWLGDVALVWGVDGKAGVSSRGNYLPLTADGAGLVLILTAAFFTCVAVASDRGPLKRGVWCGLSLGTSSGIAGFAAVPLAQATNQAGFLVFGWIG